LQYNGRYFTLQQEPTIVRDVPSLAKLLFPEEESPTAKLRSFYLGQSSQSQPIVVGVRYPRRKSPGFDWLWFMLLPPKKPELLHTREKHMRGMLLTLGQEGEQLFSSSDICLLYCHDTSQRPLQLRNQHRTPVNAAELKFSLFGLGALGSACADLLSKSGVGALDLWDPQFLSAGNVVRHLGGMWQVGLPKVLICQIELRGHNPFCSVIIHDKSVLTDLNEPSAFSGLPVLSTIADDSTDLAVNTRAIEAQATVYYLRALRAGSAARLLRVKPGVDGCLECLGRYKQENAPCALSVPAADNEELAHECGQAILASSAADLAVVAGVAVRWILQDVIKPSRENHLVWTSDGIPGVSGLEEPFSKRSVHMPPHPDCSVCGLLQLQEVVLSETTRQFLLSETAKHKPNETGGVLVGRVHEQKIIVTAASEAGPNAEHSPTRFLRDGAFAQQFLKEECSKKLEVKYLGEWHSHPSSSCSPSTTDITSLVEISQDPNYSSECPVMLIVGQGDQIEATCFPRGRTKRVLLIRYTEEQ
jgi:integrative and conjugative element protein (TIGR02256 family)